VRPHTFSRMIECAIIENIILVISGRAVDNLIKAMSKKLKQKNSPLKSRLNATRVALQELAGFLSWATSGKAYMNIEAYEQLQDRQMKREKLEHLRYLQRSKMIETQKIGKRLMFRLTEKGWTQALRDKIKTTSASCKQGRCFVIFDVPEKERHTRNILRKFLKECGFIRLQHSVWMTSKDVVAPLKQLLQRRKLERWIRIIQGNIIAASPLDRLVIRQNYRT